MTSRTTMQGKKPAVSSLVRELMNYGRLSPAAVLSALHRKSRFGAIPHPRTGIFSVASIMAHIMSKYGGRSPVSPELMKLTPGKSPRIDRPIELGRGNCTVSRGDLHRNCFRTGPSTGNPKRYRRDARGNCIVIRGNCTEISNLPGESATICFITCLLRGYSPVYRGDLTRISGFITLHLINV